MESAPESAREPPLDSAREPPSDSAREPPLDSATEPPLDSAMESAPDSAMESAPDSATEPPLDSATEPPLDSATEPSVESSVDVEQEKEELKDTKYNSELNNQEMEERSPIKVKPEFVLSMPVTPEDTNYEYRYEDLQKTVKDAQKEIATIQRKIAEKDIKLKNFNCVKDDPIGEYFSLFEYILDCNDLCMKDVNWYNVILNQEKYDNEYELTVEQLNTNYIRMDTEELNATLLEFVDDDELEEIFRNRIVQCAYMEPEITYPPYPQPPIKPDPAMKELVEQYNKDVANYNPKLPEPIIEPDECHKCMNDCILYLNPSYKGFLSKKHDRVTTVDKLRMLVYCELRLNQLMKILKLEADRLFMQNYLPVSEILNKISEKHGEFSDIKKQKDEEIEKNTTELSKLNDELKRKKNELSTIGEQIKKLDTPDAGVITGGADDDIDNIDSNENDNSGDDGGDLSVDNDDSDDSDLSVDSDDSDDSDLSVDSDDSDLSVDSDDSDLSVDSDVSDLSVDSDDSDLSADSDDSDVSDLSVDSDSSVDSDDSDLGNITQEEISDDESIGDDIDKLPNCETIANDIKNGIIKRDNFIYLTNKCLDEVDQALIS